MIGAQYERAENTLRVWHPRPLTLDQPALVDQFFQELSDHLRRCPEPPYLLVDYANLHISPAVTEHYAARVRAYRQQVAGVFRYNLSAGTEGVLTRVAVLVANRRDANIFPDEASAREAIRRARQSASG